MERDVLLKLWDESWDEGIWIAPWSRAVGDLRADQARWSPASERHCIWQIVNHVCIWREYTLARLEGRPARSPTEGGANFAMPEAMTEASWRQTIDRLRQTHDGVREAIARPDSSLERLRYHLGHDCYHLGQIMYLRALQGLPSIE
jgi:uncharacterized damage-inducible protein DinB